MPMLQEVTWTHVSAIFHYVVNVPPQYCERISAISHIPTFKLNLDQKDKEFQQDKIKTFCTKI